MVDRWFPGPVSHPVPTVSGCRTDRTFQGDPRVPGPPECLSADWGGFESLGVDPGLTTDTLQELGIPVPENISLPSYTGLEETMSVHLQAFRIGDILFTLCSCEQWHEQSRNIKTRTNRTQGDQWNGYVWPCEPDGATITQHECDRMRAQVLNDAAGWNDPEYAPYAESEPTNVEEIKGNYTHSELPAEQGYTLTVAIGNGERLQRLHRDLPRVPARRPLPQVADRLGPALERLHGDAPRRHGRTAERRRGAPG